MRNPPSLHDVADVRTGKEIVVRFSAADEAAAREAARTVGDQLLANPVIEGYAIERGACSPSSLRFIPRLPDCPAALGDISNRSSI